MTQRGLAEMAGVGIHFIRDLEQGKKTLPLPSPRRGGRDLHYKRGIVYHRNIKAGILEKMKGGFQFQYLPEYLSRPDAEAVSLTLPLRAEPYESRKMFPYFKGLIPEGWLLDLTSRTLKIDPENVFDLLLRCCKDCIGATGIYTEEDL